MVNLLDAVILGIVEGITEFLPVSSTGHLILVNSMLGLSGEKIATFDIVIQLGAILAVVVMYRQRFTMLVRPVEGVRFSGVRGLWFLFLTCLPASALGLLTHSAIKEHLFGPQTVAMALFAGALAILAVERYRPAPRSHELDDITWKLALGVGLFQCCALWPGFSRSAATIMGAMLLGSSRKLAAEYSFIAAVPIMVAATGLDLYKTGASFTADEMLFVAVGFAVSFVSAWVAVKWFIGFVSSTTLTPFAWYRLALAPVVWFLWPQ